MKHLPKSVPCTHPDHADNNEDCEETAIGCSPYCECCLDPYSVHSNKMQARIHELRAALWDFVDVARSIGPVQSGSAVYAHAMRVLGDRQPSDPLHGREQ